MKFLGFGIEDGSESQMGHYGGTVLCMWFHLKFHFLMTEIQILSVSLLEFHEIIDI